MHRRSYRRIQLTEEQLSNVARTYYLDWCHSGYRFPQQYHLIQHVGLDSLVQHPHARYVGWDYKMRYPCNFEFVGPVQLRHCRSPGSFRARKLARTEDCADGSVRSITVNALRQRSFAHPLVYQTYHVIP